MIDENKYQDKEDSHNLSSNSSDFYTLLDKLLPLGSQVLREILNEYKESLEDKSIKAGKDIKLELEFEKEKVKCLQNLLENAIQQYQRVSADYANFQKRVPKQISDTIFYEKEIIIKSLLPVLDNFEHTLQNAHSVENVDDFIKGIRIIYDQLLSILQSHGVEQIQALGEKFDPTLHEAMLRKTEPQQEDNLILEEFQKGYKLNGRVIRPSRVIVNKQPTEQIKQEQTDIEDETTDTQ
jgi:molecular chaperone GrpE